MSHRPLFLLLAILTLPAVASADNQSWLQAGVEWRPIKRLTLHLDQQLRLGTGVPVQGRSVTGLGATWDFAGPVRLGGEYRLVVNPALGAPDVHHRGALDFGLRFSPGDFRIDWRTRGQFRAGADGEEGIDLRPGLRNRIQARWKSPWNLDPFLSAELFSDVNGARTALASRVRLEGGLSWSFDPFKLVASYRADVPIQDGDPLMHILGLQLEFTLPDAPGPDRPATPPTTGAGEAAR